MITSCPNCRRKTRQIDASEYAGDYHSPPSPDDMAKARQCTECGSVYHVHYVGKTIRNEFMRRSLLPPRNDWEEPLL